ncbi:hypothetical protein [Pseudoalteromonas sp. MTN2-4]|uniref:hypothetical protein n=1 Tax=Pseudoalteromonas sp. MTN2-4 TaxID=3056555 RepID=UPI0036F1B8E7
MTIPHLDWLGPIVCLFTLALTWKDINIRYLLLCCLLSSVIGLSTLSWAMTKPILFYLWSMSMSGLFFIFVFGRRYWAYKFQKISFFTKAYEQHRYTLQEATLLIVSLICIFSNFITFIEVYLYWIDWLDNAYYKLYVRDFLQKFMIVISTLVCFSLVFKSNRKYIKNIKSEEEDKEWN